MNDEDFRAFTTNRDIDLVSPTDIMLSFILLALYHFVYACVILTSSLCLGTQVIVFFQQPRQPRWQWYTASTPHSMC